VEVKKIPISLAYMYKKEGWSIGMFILFCENSTTDFSVNHGVNSKLLFIAFLER
jgi:hypothetical protein